MEHTLEEEKVAAFKWPKDGRVFFYIDGAAATRLLRDSWQSDNVENAIKTGVEGFGMDQQTAIDICTGKMMLIGDSRIESYPGGLEGVPDDGRFEDRQLTVEEMVPRLEEIFVTSTAFANAIKRDYDLLLSLPTKRGYNARGPFRGKGEGQGGPDRLRTIEEYQAKAKKSLEGLEHLYPLVGKKMSDLPIHLIPTTPSEMEGFFLDAEWAKSEAAIQRQQEQTQRVKSGIKESQEAPMPDTSWFGKKDPDIEKIQEAAERIEEEEDAKEDELVRNQILGCIRAAGDIVQQDQMKKWLGKLSEDQLETIIDDLNAEDWGSCHRKIKEMMRWPEATEEDLVRIGSCWITPEGRVFGGDAYAWIHIHILDSLSETGYFDDLPYDGEKEDSVEKNGWIKLSGGHGFMLWHHNAPGYVITEAQKEKVIDWCLANEMDRLEWNGDYVDLQEFVNLSCEEIRTEL